MTTTEYDPQAAAEAASQPGTFSFMDRLLGRNMPKDDLVIYLDEAAAYLLQQKQKEFANIKDADDPRLDELASEQAALEEALRKSRYTFHLEAIPSDEYDKVITDAHAEFESEVRTTLNPLTNEAVEYMAENAERDEAINRRIWARFIRAIEDPDGNRDEQITEPVAGLLRQKLPLAAVGRITRKINELRMAADWMDAIQDEGFFPTP